MKMFLSFQHIPFPCWNVVMFCSSSRCWVQWCVQFVKYEWLTCKLYIYFLFLYYNKKFKKKAGQTGKFYVYFTIILKVKKYNEIFLHSNNNSLIANLMPWHSIQLIIPRECAQLLSHVWFLISPWTLAHLVLLFMEFSRQEYWSGLPLPTPGDLHDLGIEPTFLVSPVLVGRFFTTSATW